MSFIFQTFYWMEILREWYRRLRGVRWIRLWPRHVRVSDECVEVTGHRADGGFVTSNTATNVKNTIEHSTLIGLDVYVIIPSARYRCLSRNLPSRILSLSNRRLWRTCTSLSSLRKRSTGTEGALVTLRALPMLVCTLLQYLLFRVCLFLFSHKFSVLCRCN